MTKQLAALGLGLVLSLMAGTAFAEVVVVVSHSNPVDGLTRAQLTDIYLGRLNSFPNGNPALPIDQSEGSPAHDQFYREYLGQSAAQIKAHWSKLIFTGRGRPPRAVQNGNAVIDFVAGNPNAIGYVDPSLVDDRLQIVSIE